MHRLPAAGATPGGTSGVGPSISDDDGLADAPMITDADASTTPGDAAPGSGWHLGASMGILSALYSSSKARNESVSMRAKSTDISEGSTPDAPLAYVLSKVSPTLGLGLLVAVS